MKLLLLFIVLGIVIMVISTILTEATDIKVLMYNCTYACSSDVNCSKPKIKLIKPQGCRKKVCKFIPFNLNDLQDQT